MRLNKRPSNSVRRLTSSLLRIACPCVILAAICGCATAPGDSRSQARRVAPDKPQIEQSKTACVFTWRGEPAYSFSSDWAVDAFRVNRSLRTRNSQQIVRESGIYGTFEQEFMKLFRARSGVALAELNISKTNRVVSVSEGKERINVLATAQKQGHDVVFEVTVWPSWTERTRKNPNYPTPVQDNFEQRASIKADLTVQRVSDGFVLWKCSITSATNFVTTIHGNSPDFKALAASAADRLVKSYDQSH